MYKQKEAWVEGEEAVGEWMIKVMETMGSFEKEKRSLLKK
jgi:hypothetical protein